MPVYIEKINGDVNRPTNRPTDRQGEYRAICLFESKKIEKRQRIAIFNNHEEKNERRLLFRTTATKFFSLFGEDASGEVYKLLRSSMQHD